MRNVVKKPIVNDLLLIGRNESWFSDMAKEGLLLKKIGSSRIHFERGEPQDLRYRIDVAPEKPDEEQIALYRSCGWDYVTSWRDYHVYSSPQNRNAPELHTDPAEQSYTMEAVRERMGLGLLLSVLLALAMTAMIAAIYFLKDSAPFLAMMDGTVFQQVLLIVIEFALLYRYLRIYLQVRRIHKDLKTGKPINHKEDWRKPRRRYLIANNCLLVAALVSILIPFYSIYRSESRTLPAEPDGLPLVRLSELERAPGLIRDEGPLTKDGIDWLNSIRTKWSPFAPFQFEASEFGIVPEFQWEDGSGPYTPSLRTEYYALSVPAMQDRVVRDLVRRNIDGFEGPVNEREEPGFDQLFTYENGDWKMLFAGRDGQALYVRYQGNESLERLIGLCRDVLNT